MLDYINKFNTVWFAPTYNCNNKCVWCYASSNLLENRCKSIAENNEDKAIELLDDLKIKQLLLIGGEPTLYSNLVKLIGKANHKGIKTGLVTNGRRLKDKNLVRELKKEGLEYLSVSIEGYDERTHDSITQSSGSFLESLEGIENSLGENIRTSTNTTGSSKNINDFEKIVDLLAQYKLKSITFNICGVCLGSSENNSYTISPSHGIKAFEQTYKYFKTKNKNVKLKLISPVPLCNLDYNILEELKETNSVKGTCHIFGGRNFVLDYNGDILPCTHFTGFPMFNVFSEKGIMNVKEFLQEYNNPENIGNKFRERLKYYPSAKCSKGCEERCTGGCPLFWSKYNPTKEIKGFSE